MPDYGSGSPLQEPPTSPRPSLIVKQCSESFPAEPADSNLKRTASILTTAAAPDGGGCPPAATAAATAQKKERLPPRPKVNEFEDSLFTPLVAATTQPPSGTPKVRPPAGEAATRPAVKDAAKAPQPDGKPRLSNHKAKVERLQSHSSFTCSAEGATSPRIGSAETLKAKGGKREGQASWPIASNYLFTQLIHTADLHCCIRT